MKMNIYIFRLRLKTLQEIERNSCTYRNIEVKHIYKRKSRERRKRVPMTRPYSLHVNIHS